MCERSSKPTPTKFSCSGHKTHGAGATPGASGAWQLTANYTYFIDRGLVNAIASQATGKSVIEFGRVTCAPG